MEKGCRQGIPPYRHEKNLKEMGRDGTREPNREILLSALFKEKKTLSSE